jgi:hypothetical protein
MITGKPDEIGQKGYATLRFNVIEAIIYDVEIHLDPLDPPGFVVFPRAMEGYTDGYHKRKIIEVENTGTMDLEGLVITLRDDTYFWIYRYAQAFKRDLAVGESMEIHIWPRHNGSFELPPSHTPYTDVLTITDSEGKLEPRTVQLHFEVGFEPVYEVSIATSGQFHKAREGYGENDLTRLTRVFTINNTGTEDLSGLKASLLDDSKAPVSEDNKGFFEIVGALSSDTIAFDGEAATISIRPRLGLVADTYSGYLLIEGDMGAEAEIPLTFIVTEEEPYEIEISFTDSTLGIWSAQAGYGEDTSRSFTIKNIGKNTISGINIDFDEKMFEIVGPRPKQTLDSDETATFFLRPVKGLTVISFPYESTLTVRSAEGATDSMYLSFAVRPLVIPGDVNGDGYVNFLDLFLLLDFIKGLPVVINEANANLSGGNGVGIPDLLRWLALFYK